MEKLRLRLGGTPKNYDWSTGARTTDNSVPYTSTISNLDGDQYYYVTVTNSSSCTKIDSAYVSEPDSLIPFFLTLPFITCFGSSTGR